MEASLENAKKVSFEKALRYAKKNLSTVIGVFLCLILIIIALGAYQLAPHDYRVQSIRNRYLPPSSTHYFGTDGVGRDVFSRVLIGTRTSLFIAILSIVLAMLFGIPIGVWAGYKGGAYDDFITRIIDILMSFPSLILGLMIATALGPGPRNTIIAISLALLPRFARVSRAPTIALREREFIESCQALGAKDFRIMAQHILPNIFGDVLVMATLWMATAIRIEASLSFLGLGTQPPTPSWGMMMKQGVDRILIAPWMAFFPGLAIMISSIGFNLIGDGIRDQLDPRIRNQM